jgi:FAD/FMN-containing dehydrogenase/Fe-S oxidoreductase
VDAIKIAHNYRIPIIARGAATGITGGCIGSGLIIDTAKYLNKIKEINFESQYAVVEPGVVQDHLNKSLAHQGFRLGPETSTGNRATIGGMLANNAAGAHSLLYGKMVDHVIGVEIALANGELIEFGDLNEKMVIRKCAEETTEGRLYRETTRIARTYHDDIKKNFPNIPRRVSGYNLDELIKPGLFNLSKLIVGSEGTLGIVTKIKLKIRKKPEATALCLLHYQNILEAMQSVNSILAFHPIAIEMIDHHILAMGRLSPKLKGKLDWLKGDPQVVFAVEFQGASQEEAFNRAIEFKEAMTNQNTGYAQSVMQDPKEIATVWEIRKAGLGLLLSQRTYSRAIAFIEDLSIGPDKLASFMEKFLVYLKSVGKEAGIYGHAGSGCMHIRPYMDLRKNDDLKLMQKIMLDVSDLVLDHGGALSGEHGDGLIRSWLNKKMFGENIYRAFTEIKAAFDPVNLMNPGKIVDGPPLEKNLRLDPNTSITKIKTFLDFQPEGGFELAVDLCNGNAQCRKMDGTMCPSFQASNDEYHTTRARAQALRGIINSRLPIETLTSHQLYDVFDLCIECKGCKTECPSQVDMAKMKAEFLYHYHTKHGHPLRNQLFGHIGSFFQLASQLPHFFNALGQSKLSHHLLSWIGITPHRTLPLLADHTFSHWFKQHPPLSSKKEVVLFNDTYNEFNEPSIGIAAVKVLERFGYKVHVPSWKCCGRPFISKGMLQQAKSKAEALVDHLFPYVQKGLPIIGLEPSCILTVKDDFRSVLGSSSEKAAQVAKACTTFDEFLHSQPIEMILPFIKNNQPKTILMHGHCHQKALVGTKPSLDFLKGIPNVFASEIDSGCCGMAGSFGYEKEHYLFSLKIAEQRLFPAIRAAPDHTILVANGVSCRSQIAHGTNRKPMHLAEIVASLL